MIIEEKVLTASARDYFESVGKKLSDYEMKGVISLNSDFDHFLRDTPNEAEVVTDLRVSLSPQFRIYSGTALIPRGERR